VSAFVMKENQTGIDTLRRFAEYQQQRAADELCEMCGVAIPAPDHCHVVSVERRRLLCTCRACYLLFTSRGAAQGRYKAVPRRYLYLRSFQLVSEQWDRLQIPVGIAFFFFNSALRRVVAIYPSPMGPTESQLPLNTWQEIAAANPILAEMETDVEALLVRDSKDGHFECFLVPIDACYELTGYVRRYWKGFHGGEEAWREIDDFFSQLRAGSDER
jgi:hypothetical protein